MITIVKYHCKDLHLFNTYTNTERYYFCNFIISQWLQTDTLLNEKNTKCNVKCVTNYGNSDSVSIYGDYTHTHTYIAHIKKIRIIYTKMIIMVRAGLWVMKAS